MSMGVDRPADKHRERDRERLTNMERQNEMETYTH